MEVTCPACAARYSADEDKLRGKTARMRCRACDTVWVVSGPEETSLSSTAARRVKRNAEREQRDLFATREPDLGSVPSTMRPPPPSNDGVGARNETSVLFTVASLKGGARVKTPEPSEAPPPSSMHRMDDDEGVIDLNALASVPPRACARAEAPLFSEPPPAAFARDATPSSSSIGSDLGAGPFKLSKRMMAGIGAAAVAVVLMGIGVAAAFKGEEPVARAQSSLAAPIPSPTTPAVAPKAPEPAPAPAPAASTASSSDDDSKEDAKPSKKGKRKNMSGGGKLASGSGKVSSGGGKSSTMSKVASSGVAPIKPAADKCGCKGDFNCILRCTATGK